MTTVVLILIKQELDLDAAFDVVLYMILLYLYVKDHLNTVYQYNH